MSRLRSPGTRLAGFAAATSLAVLGLAAPAQAADNIITDGTTEITTGEWVCDTAVHVEKLDVIGEVTLILDDGCDLTATTTQTSPESAPIQVEYGNSLTIDGTGSLDTTGFESAGIGGGARAGNGTITINGGTITATSSWGAGIGSGNLHRGARGTIAINGGTITTTSDWGAGIGGGEGSHSGPVTINGGTITATGGSGAGIGGGNGGTGTVTIHDGLVSATSTTGAGIGGGIYAAGNGTTVVITGGDVTASADTGAAGIGTGHRVSGGSGGVVTISGDASVTANGGDATNSSTGSGAGIGTGHEEDGPTDVTIATTGTVTAIGGESGFGHSAGAAIGSGGAATHRLVTTSISGTSGIASILPVDMDLPDGAELPDGMTHGTFSVPVDGSLTFAGSATDPSEIAQLFLDGTEVHATEHTIATPDQDHELTATAVTSIVDASIVLDAPARDEPLAESATPDHDTYTVDSVTWDPADSPASPAAAYTATVVLAPIDGHGFTDAPTGTINGEPAEATKNADGTLTLTREFPATDKAAPMLTLDADPATGTTTPGDVALTATLTGAFPDIDEHDVELTVDGPDGVEIVSAPTDENGIATYTLDAPRSGEYTFGAAFAGDESNRPADAETITGYAVSPIPVAEASVTIDAPTSGSGLAADATPDDETYTVDSVAWGPNDAAAVPGTPYTATLTLSPAAEHTFTDDTAGTVNGEPAEAALGEDGTLTLVAEFPATAKSATELELDVAPPDGAMQPGEVTLTATLAGAYPDDAGHEITFRVEAAEATAGISAVDAQILTAVTGEDGTASVTLNDLAPGDYAFSAAYAGDGANAATASDPISGYGVAPEPTPTPTPEPEPTAAPEPAPTPTESPAPAPAPEDPDDLAATGGTPPAEALWASLALLTAGVLLLTRRGARADASR
ncbi:Ig-like domain repeat protein [Microbacterium suaedae]|uniref:Ig-like domain repeat protein n=1 Tax=Microbacterium suaedae TaxID=2067813 RepID=UPI000DA17148|nr:Ig-like domain repeat protein [Microbacterium suaedae]